MDRGDIYHIDLDPTKGKEQQGTRFVLIVSPRDFNRPERRSSARSRKAATTPEVRALPSRSPGLEQTRKA
jgi:mRNA-degrading endonuclease toxin of MazEF toxin-antitoxin module